MASITLHMDVSGTLIGFNDIKGLTQSEHVLYAIATRVTGLWDQKTEQTYAAYVKSLYHKSAHISEQKADLRQLFLMMKDLEHSETQKYAKLQDNAIDAIEEMKQSGCQVFPSFYRLLERLEEKKIAYRLVLRTNKEEGISVAEEITRIHPHIQFGAPIVMETAEARHTLETSKTHLFVKERFCIWYEAARQRVSGKPFPVDEHSFFCDDNINVGNNAQEINIVRPYDLKTKEDLVIQDLLGKALFKVDSLEAISDPDYYINLLPIKGLK